MSRTPDQVPPPVADAPRAGSPSWPQDGGITGPEAGRRRPLVPWLVAAIAAVSALWLARQNLALNAELDTQSLAASEMQILLRALRQQLEAEQLLGRGEVVRLRQSQTATDPARLQVTFLGAPSGEPAGPRAVVLWNPSTSQGVIVATGLPPAAPGEDYQLWLATATPLAPRAGEPTMTRLDGGVFTVDPATGEARHAFNTTGRPPTIFTVTLERHGGAPKPVGPVVLAAQ